MTVLSSCSITTTVLGCAGALLKQMACMWELLSNKEAELAEVKSELTFARGDVDAVRGEAEAAMEEVKMARLEVESVTRHQASIEHDHH